VLSARLVCWHGSRCHCGDSAGLEGSLACLGASVARKTDDRSDATSFSRNGSGMIGKLMRESVDSFLGFPIGDGVSEENRAAVDALLAEAEGEARARAEQLCESGPLPVGRMPRWRAPTATSPGTGALLTA
jgi:hypothetical protein